MLNLFIVLLFKFFTKQAKMSSSKVVLLLLVITVSQIFACDLNSECKNGGYCEQNPVDSRYQQCICTPGYEDADCGYRQKSMSNTFWFSFLLGTLGVDRFFLGHTASAACKLIFGLLGGCVSVGVLIGSCKADSDKSAKVCGCCTALFGLITFIWWMVDFSLIIQGDLYEANGHKLHVDW